MSKKLVVLIFLLIATLFPAFTFAQVTTVGGGTGSTSPSGILTGVTGNLHLQTLKIGSGLTFNGTTLAATGGSSASSTLLSDSNTFSGTINKFTNAPALGVSGVLKGNGSSAITAAVNGTDFTLLTAKTCNSGDFVSAATAAGVLTCTTPATGSTYTATYPIIITGTVISTGFGTTTTNIFSNLNTFNAGILVVGSSTFVGNATTTGTHYAGTASSTLLFGANLSACTGTNALTWTGGQFGCQAQPQGTVTAISVASSNGFAGSSSGGATPTLTLTTTVTANVLKGNGTAISGAVNGTDYTLVTANTCGAGQFFSSATAAGVFGCGTPTDTVGNWFTPGTNFGTAVNSTSTIINFTAGIFASSTSRVSTLLVGSSTAVSYTNAPLITAGNVNAYTQSVLQNINAGSTASADYILGNDISTNTTYYGDLGFNSSQNSDSNYTAFGKNALYLYNSDNEVDIAAASSTSASSTINFFTGGTLVGNRRMVITSAGNVGVGTTSPGSIFAVNGVANFTTGTTTFYGNGLNIPANQCYAVNGVCLSSGSTLTGTTGQVAYFSGANTAVGTSSLFISTAGNIGIATTTPGSMLTLFSSSTVQTSGIFTVWAATSSMLTSTNVVTFSSSGTYSKPANLVSISVQVIGGGGGAGAAGPNGGIGGNGGNATASSFTYNSGGNTITANGGTGGVGAGNTGKTGAGGTASGGDTNTTGTAGTVGGSGGGTGYSSSGGATGLPAIGGSVPGGGGGGGNGAGQGGGGGGYAIKTLLASQLGASETVTIGAGGGGGGCGNQATGGNGGDAVLQTGGSAGSHNGNFNCASSGNGGAGGNAGVAGSNSDSSGGGGGAGGAGAQVIVTETLGTSKSATSTPFISLVYGSYSISGNATTTALMGVGTSSPSATFAVESSWGGPVQMIAGWINAIRYTFQEIDGWGHLITGGTAPTCGAGCSTVTGDDRTMRMVTGSSVSSATINFSHTYGTTPVCVANEESAGVVSVDASSTPTAVIVDFATSLTAVRVAVVCQISNNFTF